MASIVVAGDTSGTVTLSAPATAGTTTLTLPTTSGTVLTSASSIPTSQLSGSISAASLPAGSVLQVVSANYSIAGTTSGTTYIDTGLTASITPSSSSNKILIIVHHNGCTNTSANTGLKIRLLKDSTTIITFAPASGYGPTFLNASVSTAYLDSPATTSSTIYKTQYGLVFASGVGTIQNDSATSTITLMEIKG